MSFTELFIQPTGSNNNSGSTISDTPVYSCSNGDFDGVSVYTPNDGSTPASTVSVGMYAALYKSTDIPFGLCIAQVTAVAAGVNGAITFSTTIKYGTFPTNSAGAHNRICNVGGALQSLVVTPILSAGTVPQSTRINIKAATYANAGSSRTISSAGTADKLLWWRGYKTTPGDQDGNNAAVAGVDIPSITFTTGTLTVSGVRNIFSNIDFSGAPLNPLITISGGFSVLYGCRIENTAVNAASHALSYSITGANLAVRCFIKSTTTATQCVNVATNYAWLVGCQIVGGAIGINSPGVIDLLDCIIDSPAGDGLRPGATAFTVDGCSFYGAGGSSGNAINIAIVPGASLIRNCHFENWLGSGKYAINNTSGTNADGIRSISNSYYNVAGVRNGFTEDFTIFSVGVLPSQGFVNPAIQNFSPNLVLQNVGFPGKFEVTTVYRGYASVGALQPETTNTAVLAAIKDVTDKLSTMLEVDGPVWRYTINALEQSPGGGSPLNLAQVLNAARDVSAVADTSLTLNDAFHCAIGGAAGKESVVGTTYTIKTPSTGTTLRIFTLDAAVNPTSRT